jgi:hypothetical protein
MGPGGPKVASRLRRDAALAEPEDAAEEGDCEGTGGGVAEAEADEAARAGDGEGTGGGVAEGEADEAARAGDGERTGGGVAEGEADEAARAGDGEGTGDGGAGGELSGRELQAVSVRARQSEIGDRMSRHNAAAPRRLPSAPSR